MSIKDRVAYLEDWQRREPRPRGVKGMSEAELESLLSDALGVGPEELTDELLEAHARGEV